MWGSIVGVASNVIGMGKNWLESKNRIKETELQHKLDLAEAQKNAKIRLIENSQRADITWDKLSLRNSDWKDEWFTILLSIPVVMCFVPGWDVYVENGFASFSGTPEWYQYAFGIAIASSFGYRKFIDFMERRKG